jgi:uncharacterized protein (TIGR01777 family)
MATILITGGTGMIGKALTRALIKKGDRVIILTRKIPDLQYGSRVSYALWDLDRMTIDIKAVAEADHIVHLAGANVGEKRWTDKRKKEIVDSRVKSSELLVKALKETPNKVKSVVSSSAVGLYGPDPSVPNPKPFREEDPSNHDFLGETCIKWEASIGPVKDLGKRLVKLRTGIVLDHHGGALREFEKPLRFRFATILGSGKQIISWIQIGDIVNAYIYAMENEQMNGVYNAVGPNPVTNKELILALARAKKGNFYIPMPVPAFALKLALGEMSIEVLKSVTVSCDKLRKAGFTFEYPDLKSLDSYFNGR